jgi:hypothetical protein
MQAIDCPHSVAMAAPLMPHLKENIKIGAIIRFANTDKSADIIAFFG